MNLSTKHYKTKFNEWGVTKSNRSTNLDQDMLDTGAMSSESRDHLMKGSLYFSSHDSVREDCSNEFKHSRQPACHDGIRSTLDG